MKGKIALGFVGLIIGAILSIIAMVDNIAPVKNHSDLEIAMRFLLPIASFITLGHVIDSSLDKKQISQ